MKTCEVVRTWEPLRFCGTVAHWRYPASGGGHMYLCDEHGIQHINQAEHAPEGWDNFRMLRAGGGGTPNT